MPVMGKKPRKKFRGLVRAQIKRAYNSVNSLVNRQGLPRSHWMTEDELANAETFRENCQRWLQEQTPVT